MQAKADSPAIAVKQLLRGLAKYAKATALDIAISTGKKAALFAAAITCFILALVYLSIGLLRALAGLFFHPAPPYLILGGILLLAAVVMIMIAASRKAKTDEDAQSVTEAKDENGADTGS